MTAGAGWALAVDAATFAVSAALLSRMRIADQPKPAVHKTFLADLKEGWDAFRSRTWMWTFVAWFSFGNLLYGCWAIVGPLVAERDLGGAGTWGLIIAASGAGGVVGGLLALRAKPRRPLFFAALGLSIFFVPLALLALGLPAPLIAAGAIVSEMTMVLSLSIWESTLQRHIPAETLARVSAYDWFGSLAFLPVGLALWGPIAAAIGYESALWLAFGLHVASIVPLLAVRESARCRPTRRNGLRQQQLVRRARPRLAHGERARRDLLRRRLLGARLHRVGAGLQRRLERRGVERVDRADAARVRAARPRA